MNLNGLNLCREQLFLLQKENMITINQLTQQQYINLETFRFKNRVEALT
jgi:hypothetical protein